MKKTLFDFSEPSGVRARFSKARHAMCNAFVTCFSRRAKPRCRRPRWRRPAGFSAAFGGRRKIWTTIWRLRRELAAARFCTASWRLWRRTGKNGRGRGRYQIAWRLGKHRCQIRRRQMYSNPVDGAPELDVSSAVTFWQRIERTGSRQEDGGRVDTPDRQRRAGEPRRSSDSSCPRKPLPLCTPSAIDQVVEGFFFFHQNDRKHF